MTQLTESRKETSSSACSMCGKFRTMRIVNELLKMKGKAGVFDL